MQHGVGDFPDEVMQASAGLLQRSRGGLHPLDEAAPAIALSPEARLPKEDDWTDRSLGDVVRRLDVISLDERPHRRLRPENAPAHARRLVARAAGTLVEEPDHPDAKLSRPALQGRAIDLIVAIEVLQSEHAVHQAEQALADPAQRGLTFGHAAKVANQVVSSRCFVADAATEVIASACALWRPHEILRSRFEMAPREIRTP